MNKVEELKELKIAQSHNEKSREGMAASYRKRCFKIIELETQIAEEAKPEYIECEINPPDSNGQMWVQWLEGHTMDFGSCIGHKDFIGFKYEDGIVRTDARTYSCEEQNGTHYRVELDNLKSGLVKVLTPTHVLFKENTK
jgi:hypothetical protein